MKPTEPGGLKVVAHLRDGKLIKGYVSSPGLLDLESLKQQPLTFPEKVTVKDEGSGKFHDLRAESLKALFFVKRFEGRTEYSEVKFFTATPDVEGLWVRIRFYDNEKTEGLMHNSLQSLINPGFFLKPPDPLSNNEIAYVLKSSLTEFRVLGVKTSY